MTVQTFNRVKLRKLVEAGKVETVGMYSFDDTHGADRSNAKMPVAIMPTDWRDQKHGVCYIRGSEFTTKSGRAYTRDSDGIVTLIVHGNSNYDLRIVS